MLHNIAEDLTCVTGITTVKKVNECDVGTVEQTSKWYKLDETEKIRWKRSKPSLLTSVWKIGLCVGMLVLAQNEHILKTISEICIKSDEHVVFFSWQPGHILWGDGIYDM